MTSAPTADTRLAWLIAWLTRIALIVAALATASWGAGAHIAVRYMNPAAGEWWDVHEFALMRLGAAALGILFGIRLGARYLADSTLQRRVLLIALIAGAIVLPVAAQVCAIAARLGWSGRSGPLDDWLVGAAGYGAGRFLDKVIVALVYALKVVAFGLMVGLALAALAAAIMLVADRVPAGKT
jgi:hypothetical protein